MRRIMSAISAILFAALFTIPAWAHGGGGGGHGGGHTYVPIYGGYSEGISVVPPAKVGDYSNIKTVAVISGIGQTFTMGVKALLTSHHDIDISDWGLDQFTEKTVAHYLSQRFTVKDLPHDRAALAAIPNNFVDTHSQKAVSEYLAKLPSQGIDAFIVIRPDSEGGAPPTAGLSFDDSHGILAETSEIANYEIDVVGARTLTVIAHAMSRVALREKLPPAFAAIKAPANLANLTAKDTPSGTQRLEMKQEYTKLMAISLLETIRSLNFGITLPDVGGRVIAPLTADTTPQPKFRTIAIASAIGDSFAIVDMHTFGGVAGKTFVPVPGWQIDAHVEDLIRSNLGKRFTIRNVPVDRDALARARIDFTPKAVNGPVPGLQPLDNVDVYIVVLKHMAKTNDPVCSGLGIFGRSALFANLATVYACYDIALIDAHTLKLDFAALGTLSPKWPTALPVKSDGALWPKSLTALTPEESENFDKIVSDFLDDSVPEMLLRLRLTDRVIEYIPGVKTDSDLPTQSASTGPPAAGAAPSPPAKP